MKNLILMTCLLSSAVQAQDLVCTDTWGGSRIDVQFQSHGNRKGSVRIISEFGVVQGKYRVGKHPDGTRLVGYDAIEIQGTREDQSKSQSLFVGMHVSGKISKGTWNGWGNGLVTTKTLDGKPVSSQELLLNCSQDRRRVDPRCTPHCIGHSRICCECDDEGRIIGCT